MAKTPACFSASINVPSFAASLAAIIPPSGRMNQLAIH